MTADRSKRPKPGTARRRANLHEVEADAAARGAELVRATDPAFVRTEDAIKAPYVRLPAAVASSQSPSVRHTVIIADADPLARRVVRDALQAGTPFVVAAEASDGVEAVELVRHYRPDLVLIELSLPRLDGMSAIRQLRAENDPTRIVVFTLHGEEELELEAIRAGASGFVAKNHGTEGAALAMEAVLRGEPAISPSLTMRLVEQLRALPEAGAGLRPVRSVLTTREWEVLDLMSGGAATAAIAEALVLAEDTVYSHVKNILRKLEVHTRQEAVDAARALMRTGPAPTASGA